MYLLLFSLFFVPAGKLVDHKDSDETSDTKMNTWQMCRVILKDNVYVVVLISSILSYLVYSQFDSVLPQYFLMLDSALAVDLVTVVLVTNALTVLVAQLYLVPYFVNTSLEKRITVGVVILAVSQLLFWSNETSSTLWWGPVRLFSALRKRSSCPI